jgi:cell wall-associated NlpC family hydrolase
VAVTAATLAVAGASLVPGVALGPAVAAADPSVPAAAAPPEPTASTAGPPVAAPAAVQAALQGVPLPPIPAVDRSITDGQDPAALLAHALALLSAGQKAAPLEAALSGLQANATGDTVNAVQASAAASVADQRAAKAAKTARELGASAVSLDGALRAATLSLYMSGQPAAVPNLSGGDNDAVMAAVIGEQVALSPSGILAERKQAAANAQRAAAEAGTAQAVADADAARAQQATTAAAGQVHVIGAELANLDAASAQALKTEADSVSQQAGQDLASGSALQFIPAAPLPPPVATSTVALTWLFSELGKTYVYGATGPDTFDCSGLTQFVWNKAGVSIPRVAVDQDNYAVPVPLSDLRPGDLVFFGADVHHVGMYIGGGLMINAPQTGDVVRVSPIWWSDLVGFGRVHMPGIPVPSRAPIPANAPAEVNSTLGAVPSQTAPPPGAAPVTEPGAPPTTAPHGPPPTPPPPTTTTTVAHPSTTTSTPSTTRPASPLGPLGP